MSTVSQLEAKFGEMFKNSPPLLHGLTTALADIQSALNTLANNGFYYDLVQVSAPIQAEWPKMYYQADGRTLVVHDADVANALSPGWTDKPPGWKEPTGQPPTPSAPDTGAPSPVMLGVGATGTPTVGGKPVDAKSAPHDEDDDHPASTAKPSAPTTPPKK